SDPLQQGLKTMHPLLCYIVTAASFLAPPAADSPLHAGIELGGRGIKATILEVGPGGVFRRVFSQTHNTTLSALDEKGAFRKEALSLDIGGGNTKGGYQSDGKPLVYLAIPLGSVTFTEKVKARVKGSGESFAEAAAGLREKELLKPLSDGARAMPDLPRRKK